MLPKIAQIDISPIRLISWRRNLRQLVACLVLLSLAACTSSPKRVDGEIPFDKDSMINLADTFRTAGDYGSALRLYHRAAKENPEDTRSRLALADLYTQLRTLAVAEKYYKEVLALKPQHDIATIGLAQSLIGQNKPEEAISLLQSIAPSPQNAIKLYNSRGLAYDLNGQQNKAQMEYARGLDIAPDNISIINNFALSLAIETEYAPAIQLLSQIVNKNMGKNRARANLAMIYVMSGEEEAAADLIRLDHPEEHVEQQIQQYRWINTLTQHEKAQAIFLGLKNFRKNPQSKDEAPQTATSEQKSPVTKTLSSEQQKLLTLLQEEEEIVSQPKHDTTLDQKQSPADHNKQEMPAPADDDTLPPSSTEITSSHGNRVNTIETPIVSPPKEENVFLVQLGSYLSQSKAEQGWFHLQRKHADLFAEKAPYYKTITGKDGQSLIRLFVDGTGLKETAHNFCHALKEAGGDCFVLLTTR
ncbi:MAG: hypothetical protein CMF31_10150 [Kordiimonas sp.]|nr:hypothetical protein [Kordiimonas sp.]|tara:strand:+ start:435 stop:1853 length:1419 start_codon:yes stop_codon:yes gene_type:complete